MTRRLTLPEKLLQDLGVAAPQDIDVEAIAWDLGAKIKYRKLHTCEARIVGYGDRAIISVDEEVAPRRQRFSIAHELGHWHHHRRQCLACRSDQIGDAKRPITDPERVADDYASDLLLPRYVLEPMLRAIPKPTLKALREISNAFNASLTATILKVIETNRFPMMFVCSGSRGRRWFRSAPSIPGRWFPQEQLDPESCASSIAVDGEIPRPRLIGADAWFELRGAADFELLEQSFALPGGDVATILQFIDENMLD